MNLAALRWGLDLGAPRARAYALGCPAAHRARPALRSSRDRLPRRLPRAARAAVLCVSSALAPRLRADARQVQWCGEWVGSPGCTLPLLHTSGSITHVVPPYGGVTQPLPFTGNIAACSLARSPPTRSRATKSCSGTRRFSFRTPPPWRCAAWCSASSALYYANGIRIPMQPPVVTRAVSHVAVPPSVHGAVDLKMSYFNGIGLRHEPLGDQELPVALSYTTRCAHCAAQRASVLATALCGGDAALQELRLVQSRRH